MSPSWLVDCRGPLLWETAMCYCRAWCSIWWDKAMQRGPQELLRGHIQMPTRWVLQPSDGLCEVRITNASWLFDKHFFQSQSNKNAFYSVSKSTQFLLFLKVNSWIKVHLSLWSLFLSHYVSLVRRSLTRKKEK